MADISRRYATALFDLCIKDGCLNQCLDQAIIVRDTLHSTECRQILAHPHIPSREKIAFLHSVFPCVIHAYLGDFLALVITRRREQILVPALTAFIEMGRHAQGYMGAQITSAVPLRDSQRSALQQVLSRKLGKQVDLSLEVDPALIGGIRIYVDGRLIDRTVQKQLYDMKNSIKSGEGL